MHAKRRHLLSHFKARLLQNAYRAHLLRVRERGQPVPSVAAPESAHVASPIEEFKEGVAFQQKRLPSKYAKRKSVAPFSGTSNTTIISAAAVGAPISGIVQPLESVTVVTFAQPSSMPPARESSPPGNRVRRLSM